MIEEILFDYGEEGRISAELPNTDSYPLYAKMKVKDEYGQDIPGTGGTYADEGGS